ncbi:MAG: type II toxin-antitoxin system ParD family antitoxin [Phycisphaerae bacterium]
MTTLNISLPDPMKEFVERQVNQGGYSSSSEYVRALIREEQKRLAQATLEAKLLEGLASGTPTELTKQDWEELRRDLIRRHKRGDGQ